MKNPPLVSVMIATFNSENLLPRTLRAIRKQTYPKRSVEILIIDGGSKDKTLSIAAKYGCIVLHNDKTEPVNAKLIGLKNAKGKYLITIDHDEVIENPRSIELKVKALLAHPECKVALCSGYKKPKHYPGLNQYISEFGDPFSLFMYNFSKGNGYLERNIRKYYKIVGETSDYMLVSFENMNKQPIFELVCLGTMIDREYFMQIPRVCEDGSVLVHLFYLMLEKGQDRIVCTKKDALVHYSVDSLKAYIPKLKWRVCNNIHFQQMGQSGFTGRIRFQKAMRYKRYMYILYTISTIIPLFHGIGLALTRKNTVYLLHPLLCWYVLLQIVYQYTLKVMHRQPEFTSYDGKKKINVR